MHPGAGRSQAHSEGVALRQRLVEAEDRAAVLAAENNTLRVRLGEAPLEEPQPDRHPLSTPSTPTGLSPDPLTSSKMLGSRLPVALHCDALGDLMDPRIDSEALCDTISQFSAYERVCCFAAAYCTTSICLSQLDEL